MRMSASRIGLSASSVEVFPLGGDRGALRVDAVCNARKQVFDFLRALGLLRYQKRHLTAHFAWGIPRKAAASGPNTSFASLQTSARC